MQRQSQQPEQQFLKPSTELSMEAGSYAVQADLRPDFHSQASLQRMANQSPQVQQAGQWQHMANPGNRQSLQASTVQPIQRKAYVGQDQISIAHAVIGGGIAIRPDEVTAPQRNIIHDPFVRRYESKEEFEAHANGDPVQCGLAPSIGKWFRLPFPSAHEKEAHEFFVLGENHGVLNYREVLAAANQQNSKFLGEGGATPLDHYAQAADARGELSNPDDNALSSEILMESSLSKKLYALFGLKQYFERMHQARQAQAQGGQAPAAAAPAGPNRRTIPVADWFRESRGKQVNRDDDAEGYKQRPYYMDQEDRVFYDDGSAQAGYDSQAMIMKTIREMAGELDVHERAGDSLNVGPLKAVIEGVMALLAKDQLEDVDVAELATNLMPDAVRLTQEAANREFSNAQISVNGAALDDLGKEEFVNQTNLSRTSRNATRRQKGAASSQRSLYMLEAIQQAIAAGGYTMAGIGDNHLRHIKTYLEQKKAAPDDPLPFKMISFDDFMASGEDATSDP